MNTVIIFTSLFFLLTGFIINAKGVTAKIDVSKFIHKIELGTFLEIIPVKIIELMRALGSVTSESPLTCHTAAFDSKEETIIQLPKLLSFGFKSAKHIVEYKNQVYDIRTFHHIAVN
jgi:hypothetical protein